MMEPAYLQGFILGGFLGFIIGVGAIYLSGEAT